MTRPSTLLSGQDLLVSLPPNVKEDQIASLAGESQNIGTEMGKSKNKKSQTKGATTKDSFLPLSNSIDVQNDTSTILPNRRLLFRA